MNPGGESNQPLVGKSNTDIPGFGTGNTLGKLSGEPIGNYHLGQFVDDESKSGLITVADTSEIDIENRFKSTFDDHKPAGSNTIGGNYGSLKETSSRREDNRPHGDQTLGGAIGTGGVPSWKDVSTEAESARTVDNDYSKLKGESEEKAVIPPTAKDESLRGHVNVGNPDEESNLRNQLVGGPNPATKLSGAQGWKDVPYDVTNQMYYAENTGEVKTTEKLGQAKDGGQSALESLTNETPADKQVTTENEKDARRNAPHDPIDKENAGTTWAT